VLGINEADHEESSPDATLPLISKLNCSLKGQTGKVHLQDGSQVSRIYGMKEVLEDFACNYGVNPLYQDRLNSEDLQVSGVDDEKAIRIVELKSQPFFIATLFLPQLRSTPEAPHPLLVAYLKAAFEHKSLLE
jgi:CTP synthase (UTP-ammonia lyase)